VDLSLSRRADYAVRAALYLARQDRDEAVSVREIAAAMAIPSTFAGQVLANLTRAGIFGAKPGRGGGYWLARDPKNITLLEIVEAAEGTLRAERCALGDGPCRWDAVCPLHTFWQGAVRAVRDQLAGITLDNVRDADVALELGVDTPEDSHRRSRVLELDDEASVELPLALMHQRLEGADSGKVAEVIGERLRTTAGLELLVCEIAHPELRLILELINPLGQGARLELDLYAIEVDDLRTTLAAHARWRGKLEPSASVVRSVLTALARYLEHER